MSGWMVGRGVCSEVPDDGPSCGTVTARIQVSYETQRLLAPLEILQKPTMDKGTEEPLVFICMRQTGRDW